MKAVLIGLICAILSPLASAGLLFSAPPRLTEAQAKEAYQPLIELLSTALEQEIDFKYPRDWIEYTKMVQAGEFQIAIDDPHFVAWRAKLGSESLYHRPIAKLAGELKYYVLVPADSSISKLNDLNSKKVCALPSPALGTVLVLKNFKNPVIQPFMLPAKNDQQAIQKMQRKRCDAAVVNAYNYDNQINGAQKENLKTIFTTQALPNLTLAVTPQLPETDLEKIREAILNKRGLPEGKALFYHYGQGLDEFIPTDATEYSDYNILEGLLFDW